MAPRTIAIGDIHGCSSALETVLAAASIRADDTVVVLGDIIDRGPDSRGVIELLLDMRQRCRLVAIRGNHEEMLLDNLERPNEPDAWLMFGGDATLRSYGASARLEDIPPEHVAFMRAMQDYFETEDYFFTHANYQEEIPLAAQIPFHLRWESLKARVPGPHCSGKTAVVGHSSQKSGEVFDRGHVVCIDTYCYGGGWLTALEIDSGTIWQANQAGEQRQHQRSPRSQEP